MTEFRRHHFLPQFDLRGFTATGSSDGALHLLRPSDGHEWRGTPDSVGHQRDFYRIDGVPGVEPNQLERNFAVMEGQVGGVLGNVLCLTAAIGVTPRPARPTTLSVGASVLTATSMQNARCEESSWDRSSQLAPWTGSKILAGGTLGVGQIRRGES